jgi:hypothetical protein
MTAANATDDDGRSRFVNASLTNKEWQKIQESFKAVGLNADTVMIKTGVGKCEWPLRYGIPLIAQCCDINSRLRKDSSTPKQLSAEQSRTIEFCRAVLARLDNPRNYNRIDPDTHWLHFPRLTHLAARTRQDLSALIAELGRCRDELMARGTSQGKHFQKLHVQFWKELTRVWHANVSADVKWQKGNHLASFLIACSEPFFPEETTDGAISAFIERGTPPSK